MKCFNNLSSSITIKINNDNVDNDKGTVIGSTVSVEEIKPDVKVIPINTKTVTTTDTVLLLDSGSKVTTDTALAAKYVPLTQSLVTTPIEDFVGKTGTTNFTLDYSIYKPTGDNDVNKIIYIDINSYPNSSPYNINCSVGIYQPTISVSHPEFSGTCVVEFYRTDGVDITVMDSKILYVPSGINDISEYNSFNDWEFEDVITPPTFDFTTTKSIRLSFNPLYNINKYDFSSKYNSLGIRIRGVDGLNSFGFLGVCCAIVVFRKA